MQNPLATQLGLDTLPLQALQQLHGLIEEQLVPNWHFAMMNDTVRNQAFFQALEKNITPDSIVLDIGTGAGLLALEAARLGARHVYTCEANRFVCEAAQAIIEQNNAAQQITLIPKHSTELIIGEDMPEPADIIVAEIVNSALIGEGIVPSLHHAQQQLAKPQAHLIPLTGTLWIQGIENLLVRDNSLAETVSGFDLTPFNSFAPQYPFPFKLAEGTSNPITCAWPIHRYSFGADAEQALNQQVTLTPLRDGSLDALLCWFELDLAPGIRLSSHPDAGCHWAQLLYTPPSAPSLQTGAAFDVSIQLDARSIEITLQ